MRDRIECSGPYHQHDDKCIAQAKYDALVGAADRLVILGLESGLIRTVERWLYKQAELELVKSDE